MEFTDVSWRTNNNRYVFRADAAISRTESYVLRSRFFPGGGENIYPLKLILEFHLILFEMMLRPFLLKVYVMTDAGRNML